MKTTKTFQVDDMVVNTLSNGAKIVCRVVELNVAGTDMVRVCYAQETRPDAWLIANNKTWAAPIENLETTDEFVRHKNGLVIF